MKSTNSKLRLGMVSAGTFRHMRCYIEYFVNRGHDVTWITYDRPACDLGVRTIDLSRGADARRKWTKWKYIVAGLAMRTALDQLQVDILWGHYVSSASIVCWLSGFRPYALTAHGSDVLGNMKSAVWRNVLRRTMGSARLVNTVSHELEEACKILGVRGEYLLTACPGVDTEYLSFQDARPLQRPVRLLCTRTLDDVYDPRTILLACRDLKQQKFEFLMTFAADGPQGADLRTMAVDLGVDRQVCFRGGYNRKELPGLLHENDVYISASHWDGTSLSLLEAMSAGLVPVVSRIRSNEDWLQEGRNCLMFSVQDSLGLAQAVVKVSALDDWRRAAVEANRQTVVRDADRTANLEKIERALLSITRPCEKERE